MKFRFLRLILFVVMMLSCFDALFAAHPSDIVVDETDDSVVGSDYEGSDSGSEDSGEYYDADDMWAPVQQALAAAVRAEGKDGQDQAKEPHGDLFMTEGEEARDQVRIRLGALREELRQIDFTQLKEEVRDAKEESFAEIAEGFKQRNKIVFKQDVCSFEGRGEGANVNLNLALTKGDLYRLPLIIGDYVSDFLFIRKVKEKRINHIEKAIEREHETFLKLLDDVAHDEKSVYDLGPSNFFKSVKKIFTWMPAPVKALQRHIKEQHSFIGFNPIKKELLIPELLTFGGQEISAHLQQGFGGVDFNFPETSYFYEADEVGELQPSTDVVISGADILRFFRAPVSTITSNIGLGDANDLFFNFIGISNRILAAVTGEKPVPRFLSSGTFKICFRLALFLASVKGLDSFYHSRWSSYLMTHWADFNDLLKSYAKAKAKNDVVKLQSKKLQLRAFIEKGHAVSRMIVFNEWIDWMRLEVLSGMSGKVLLASAVLLPIGIRGRERLEDLCGDIYDGFVAIKQLIAR